MQRVLPSFDSLRFEFEKTELIDPIHNAILMGLADDRDPAYFEETPNNKGNFQVLMKGKIKGQVIYQK